MRILTIILCLFVAGCGYHVPGASDTWVGGEARTLYVSLFDNQTSEPYVENYITEALVAELSRSRTFVLTENSKVAEVILKGRIEGFQSKALAYSSSDQITDYRATMRVSLRLVNAQNDKVLWKDSLSRKADYQATVDKSLQLEGTRLAAEEVSKRLAEDIHARLLNNF